MWGRFVYLLIWQLRLLVCYIEPVDRSLVVLLHACCLNKIIVALCNPHKRLLDHWQAHVCTGSYSYVAVGASGRTYDQLAAPVRRRLLFAGEHTCKVRRSYGTASPAKVTT